MSESVEVLDPDGRRVLLLEEIWLEKILRFHPELWAHLNEILATVEVPDHVEGDPIPGRSRYFRRTATPSRWLMVVVSFEQEPGRIISAFAKRKDPSEWNP